MAQIQSGERSYFDSPDFIKIRAAVFRLFEGKQALTKQAIQYKLCEVGTPADRRDPRDLKPAFLLRGTPLLRQNVGKSRPWEPVKGVFLSPSVSDEDVPQIVDNTLSACGKIARFLLDRNTFLLADAIQERVSPGAPQLKPGDSRTLPIAGKVQITSLEMIADLSGMAGAPALASVTNDLDWLFPDDPRVWRHLRRCREANTYPVFICRKAAIASFPLFKRVAAIGIQLHHLIARDDELDEAQQLANSLGWPRMEGIQSVSHHQGLSILEKQFSGVTRSFVLQLAFEEIDRGIKLELDRGDVTQPAKLLEWGLQGEVEMPPKWIATIRQWVAWDEQGLLDKPYGPQSWP
jgi:hypothetical protein